ncbi:MAG: sigma-70 family RNA polymerase sigma factor [Planctomycetes bacterium]|nr:sigma-70 family RNA polymerase sigma factor [Planctomycetota bacterium]MCP4770750.1 sigma-70 family RNA polymerase sigma factor [Planctomycetota bacterium]MCP4862179.1 sigma-70 family RNA polymerase sigma factor [Planctomycetota bacterium]
MSERPTPPTAITPDLIHEAARGKPEAQDRWFRADYPCVYRLCLGFLADTVAAEDLAQDAMLHLLDRLDRWNPTRPYAAWRNTVVLNLCRDSHRKSNVRKKAEDKLKLFPDVQHLPDPQDAASAREVRSVITAALAQLPAREREAFVLRDLEQQKTSEVADVMAINPATVRSLLTLARRRLRGILGPALDMDARRCAGGSDV